jgi:hypothetical protein
MNGYIGYLYLMNTRVWLLWNRRAFNSGKLSTV